jgi:hypothetical protein
MPIGHQRLLRLAEFLETEVPEEKFSLCGWAACAMGWAGRLPEFQSAGFSCHPFIGPRFRNDIGCEAVRSFFEIARAADIIHLVLQDSYPDHATPEMVATRIREFVAAAHLSPQAKRPPISRTQH